MINYLESLLDSFRQCFGRKETYHWFVILVIGFMIRDDELGVTSVIRALMLDGHCYETMLHFFYSHIWDLEELRRCWYGIVAKCGFLLKLDDRFVLAGDGVKHPKEGRYMPGVKKLFQESEDSSKGQYIFGHMFGAIGAIMVRANETFCIPLMMSIQDGLRDAAFWEGSSISAESHPVQMIRNGYDVASVMGSSILLLDRYFLSVRTIRLLDELNDRQGHRLDIVTKAKRNATAYEKPPERLPGQKGRPRKRGCSVHLSDLFDRSELFTSGKAQMYGKPEDVQYQVADLLWGSKLYRELRFVLVMYNGTRSILVSTDTGLSAIQIIELYSKRFRIETCFREFKQQIGGFCYHFWTKSIGKLDHFKKRGEPDQLSKVTSQKDRDKILSKVRAYECFVHLCCIAMGILQLMSLRTSDETDMNELRYLRIRRRESPSEATVIYYLQRRFFTVLENRPDSQITQIIRRAQNWRNRSKGA